MITKKLTLTLAALALVTALGMATFGTALAQTATPPTQATPDTTTTSPRQDGLGLGLGRSFGFRGDASSFDLVAEKLGMTPTELFEALHSGKTLSEIATEKGVDLATIETALQANRVTEMKARLADAVTAGTITQEEADWWTTGIDNGWVNGGRGAFGMKGLGGGGRHGRGGLDQSTTPDATDTAPATGSSF